MPNIGRPGVPDPRIDATPLVTVSVKPLIRMDMLIVFLSLYVSAIAVVFVWWIAAFVMWWRK